MTIDREWPAHVLHRHGGASKRVAVTGNPAIVDVFAKKTAGARRAHESLAQHGAGDHSRTRRNRAARM
ncbi:MAG: hypothetical protein JWO36_383 [Myxococcales bacterium]|nr:hypothetical protein [Myxococcales bacterium]